MHLGTAPARGTMCAVALRKDPVCVESQDGLIWVKGDLEDGSGLMEITNLVVSVFLFGEASALPAVGAAPASFAAVVSVFLFSAASAFFLFSAAAAFFLLRAASAMAAPRLLFAHGEPAKVCRFGGLASTLEPVPPGGRGGAPPPGAPGRGLAVLRPED